MNKKITDPLSIFGIFVIASLLSFSVPSFTNNLNLDAQAQLIPVIPSLVANDDSAVTDEDLQVTIDVMANDNLGGTGLFVVSSVTPPSNGVAVVNNDDTVTYSPNADFFGSDSFQYTVADSLGLTQDSATVFVTINPVNDPPVAVDDSATTQEDSSVAINVLNNDTDVDGDVLSVTSVSAPSGGDATINSDGTVMYAPNPNFNENDSFSYTISDGNGANAIATVTVAITSVNDSPIPSNDSFTTLEDTQLSINVASVLANDTDPDGDILSVISVQSAVNGTVTLENNAITYTPSPNLHGTGSFQYTASDGFIAVTAQVSVTITPVNDPPLANDQAITTNEDEFKSVALAGSDADGDTLTFTILTQPPNGTLSGAAPNLTYTPDSNFNGNDSFTFKASDGFADSNVATVSILVDSVNDSPVANDDSATTQENNPVSINALANDSDTDGDSLSITAVTVPANGNTTISNGTITYTPTTNYSGADSFNYTISDGNGGNDSATVTVTVNPVNSPPVATTDSITIQENTAILISALLNDSDPDGDDLSIISTSTPSNGMAEINANNTITYTPNPLFSGFDSFNYTVSDGQDGSDQAFVYVSEVSLEKIKSGLVAFDPLNNATLTKEQLRNDNGYWRYGGSAEENFEPDAPLDFFQNSTGRYIGVAGPANATYAGYYAVTPSTDAMLFHAVITTPIQTMPGDFFQNGLYVQTDNGLINYVTCVSITGTVGTTWHLIRTIGDTGQATEFELLWSDSGLNQPLTRDCTIVTNGDNYLKLYLDGVKVYESDTLDLQMPPPFLYFLEPQNSHSKMFYGIYEDYYATKNEMLTVMNLPETANKIQMINQNNMVISEAIVNADTKIAKMDIGALHFPITANIRVLDSTNDEIISTENLQQIYGGDVYALTYPAVWTPQVETSWNIQLVDTVDDSFDIDMYVIDLFDNDKSVVDSIHAKNAKAVCYLSVGTWESWRPDAELFPSGVIGNEVIGFEDDEKWLDIRQLDVIGPIMQERLDLCKQNGFDGVDPDNVNLHIHDTGFSITYEDQLRYNQWITDEAHKRGLAVGLKNDLDQVDDLVGNYEWALVESCHELNECSSYKPFVTFGKPVFQIEYKEAGQTLNDFCPESLGNRFSGILKDFNLTSPFDSCEITGDTASLGILSEFTNGTNANGFFTTIKYGNVTETGFTPVNFNVPTGESITITTSGFGDLVFDHWKDNNMTSSTRDVWLIGDTDFTAVYRDTNSN